MLPLAAARACLSSPAPSPRPQTRAAPPSPLPRRHSTATLPRPARIPFLRPLGDGAPGASSRPTRDHMIDLGKHKGQMLGTLPSYYLRWVVAELGHGDTLVWERLAREVLDDPVYVDRVKWEHAHRFLHGDSKFDYVYDDVDDDGPLQEMAERFGWDEGRPALEHRQRQQQIPRGGGALFDTGAADPDGPRGKKDERSERMRTRREEQVRTAKLDVLGVNSGAGEASAPLTAVNARLVTVVHGGTWFVGPTCQIRA
ncbi:hypothetical protein VPH35_127758 [Triticum aestivum]